jgi:hypothetical protein
MVLIEVVWCAASVSFLCSVFRERNSASPPHNNHVLTGVIDMEVLATGRQIVTDKLSASDAKGKTSSPDSAF